MKFKAPQQKLVDLLRAPCYSNCTGVIGRDWVIVEMSMTEVFSADGVLGDFDKSLWYLWPELSGLSCPQTVSGVRLLERSPFICNDDEEFIISRKSLDDPARFDLTLSCAGPQEWYMEWDGDVGFGLPTNWIKVGC
jgi:hypothetical protein